MIIAGCFTIPHELMELVSPSDDPQFKSRALFQHLGRADDKFDDGGRLDAEGLLGFRHGWFLGTF